MPLAVATQLSPPSSRAKRCSKACTVEPVQIVGTDSTICALGANRHAVILDGNVKRVLARYHAVEREPVALPEGVNAAKPQLRTAAAARIAADGRVVVDHEQAAANDLDTIRARHVASRDELPMRARQLSRGEPVIPTIWARPV